MKDYFKRLTEHSGFALAITLTILLPLGIVSNKNIPDNQVGWMILWGFLLSVIFFWLPVLLTNRK